MKTKKKIILAMIYDIKFFPPVLSLCNILSELNYEVIYIGSCSDKSLESRLRLMNITLYRTKQYGGNSIQRFIQQIKYRNVVKEILKKEYNPTDSVLWLIHTETVSLFSSLIGKYDIVAHLLEFKNPRDKIAYRLLSPFASMNKKLKLVNRVVCCEYNRGQLVKALYNLNTSPYVLPNKPYLKNHVSDNESIELPIEIQKKLNQYKNKKIILYQGIFIRERKLDDYIEAINSLPEDFVMFLMGYENPLYYELKRKFESDRIVFLPFVISPSHLNVTKLAHIGILTYVCNEYTLDQIINILYCAPNKLYEYSMFGIPMISNELPALRYAFSQNKGGICVENLNSKEISKAIVEISDNYDNYSKQAYNLYSSIDLVNIVKSILR